MNNKFEVWQPWRNSTSLKLEECKTSGSSTGAVKNDASDRFRRQIFVKLNHPGLIIRHGMVHSLAILVSLQQTTDMCDESPGRNVKEWFENWLSTSPWETKQKKEAKRSLVYISFSSSRQERPHQKGGMLGLDERDFVKSVEYKEIVSVSDARAAMNVCLGDPSYFCCCSKHFRGNATTAPSVPQSPHVSWCPHQAKQTCSPSRFGSLWYPGFFFGLRTYLLGCHYSRPEMSTVGKGVGTNGWGSADETSVDSEVI